MRYIFILATFCSALSTNAVAQTVPAADCTSTTPIDIASTPLPLNVQRAEPVLPHRIPHYPVNAVRSGTTGDVTVGFVIDTEGSPTDITILKSGGTPDFDSATIDEVKIWRYKPALCDGKPVAARTRVRFVWQLDSEPPLGLDMSQLPKGAIAPICRTGAIGYPAASARLREQGQVVVGLTVEADGRIDNVAVLKSSSYKRLDDAAVGIVESAQCAPATLEGGAIAINTQFTMFWHLR